MSYLPIDDEHAPLYSVGQVAAMLGVQQAFLRRLDDHQVVRPRRTEGRQRRYSRREVARLQYVAALVAEGMTLAAVRRILDLEERVRRLERRLAETEARPQPRPRRVAIPPLV
jgi:DNA-binding transcriptional MerR regulator